MEENACGNVQKLGVNGIKWSDISVLELMAKIMGDSSLQMKGMVRGMTF